LGFMRYKVKKTNLTKLQKYIEVIKKSKINMIKKNK